MALDFLYRGTPGHPLHPPLTGATIGTYAFATVAAVLSKVGIAESKAAQAWTLALIVGLLFSAPTAITGFADWLTIEGGTPLWRTATLHLSAMLSATVVFAIAVGVGHADYVNGSVGGGSLVLTLIAFGLLTLGGWLGGAIVFTHGMRVLKLVDEPTSRAVSPLPKPEKEEAEA